MGGPWEDYAPIKAERGPWEDYAATPAPAPEPEPVKKPSTIELATQGLLMGAEGDVEDARAAARDVKGAIPIATGIGGSMLLGPMGGAVGYGLGTQIEKGVEVLTGDRPGMGSFSDIEKDLRGQTATAAGLEVAGAGVLTGAGKLYKGGKNIASKFRAKAPAVTEKAAERKTGELLTERTSRGPAYSSNIDEAKRLEGEVPGLKFTRGQRSNDPQAIMQERELAAAKVTATQDVEQRAASNEAVRNFFKKNFPGEENVDDVIAAIENRGLEADMAFKGAQGKLQKEAGRLGSGKDAQESGQVLRSTLKAAKDEARKKAKTLYDAVPDVKLATNELDDAVKNIGAEFRKSGDSAKDYPGGLIKQIQERIKTPKGGRAPVDQLGQPIQAVRPARPEDIGFQELRGFRTQIREAMQDAERGANPNYKLARRLKILGDSVENTINKMEGAGGEAAKAFREASAYYKQYDKAFRKGTVGEILKPGTQADGYRVANTEVAGRFFKAGKLDAADDFTRSIGNNADAKQAIRDYAAHDLLKTAENPTTGELINSKVFGWYAKNRPMLDRFGLTGEFNNVVKAQKSVDAFKGISDGFNKSAAAKMLGTDTDKALAKAFSGMGATNTGQTMRELMVMVKGEKAAEAGLKKAFAEHLIRQMETTGTDILNNPSVSVAQGKKVLAKYGPAIRELYKNEPQKAKALHTIQRAYEVLGRNAKSPLGGGSDTAEKLLEAIAQESTKRAEAIPIVGKVLKILNAYDRQQVRQILSKAIFDPDYAETLIMATKGAPAEAVKKRINNHILTEAAGVTAASKIKE